MAAIVSLAVVILTLTVAYLCLDPVLGQDAVSTTTSSCSDRRYAETRFPTGGSNLHIVKVVDHVTGGDELPPPGVTYILLAITADRVGCRGRMLLARSSSTDRWPTLDRTPGSSCE